MAEELKRGLRLFMSNNMENLADLCAILMSEYPLSSPFVHEHVVFMNQGVKTFLTQRIATQNEICTLCDFEHEWQLIYGIHRLLHPSAPRTSLYDREHLTWNVFSQIEQILAAAKEAAPSDTGANSSFGTLDQSQGGRKYSIFARMLQYLVDDEYGDKAYELAAKIADTLDQYQMYRPGWIEVWNNIPLSAFDAYEQDPEDSNNPINVFIERECRRIARFKSGFRKNRAVNGNDDNEAAASGAAGADADAAAPSASTGGMTEVLGLAAEHHEWQESVPGADGGGRAIAEKVRSLFKNNIWQINLWCRLRYNFRFLTDDGSKPIDFDSPDFEFLLQHLDRSQVTTALIRELKERDNLSSQIKGLPERVFVFGVSAMSRTVIEFLGALSRHCSVNVMLLNPCRQYWADLSPTRYHDFEKYTKLIQSSIRSIKSMQLRGTKKHKYMDIPVSTLLASDFDDAGERVEGNPLLLSYGKQGRDNLYMFYELDPVPDSIACFSEPDVAQEFTERWVKSADSRQIQQTLAALSGAALAAADADAAAAAAAGDTLLPLDADNMIREIRGGTLLAHIQRQLMDLNQSQERYIIAPDDNSLTIHSCHTKRREVEVLHDVLLECFNRARQNNENLLPRDIVVMVPTINDYAPYITAVFGEAQPGDGNYIPFVISDRSESEANTVAQALLKLLEIGNTRITATVVSDLLAEPAIARRFGLSREDVDVISQWLSDTNVYWGLDQNEASNYSEIPIPGTFAQGVERMLLGSMLGPNQVMPSFDQIEGSDTVILGKFWDFLQALRDLKARFTPSLALSPDNWATELSEMLTDRFFNNDEDTRRALQVVEEVINTLKETVNNIEHSPTINLPVFTATLKQGLTSQRNFRPFLREKVNFCSLIPMRAVPFRHVFILGLNDFDFPREERAPGFNLMAARELFERGDRSRNIEDRFLFLEALLSARDSIYFSYIGQNPVDKSRLNPSVVLSELMYYITDGCALEGLTELPEQERSDSVMRRIFREEHLNAYHPDNYMASCNQVFQAQTADAATGTFGSADSAAALQVMQRVPSFNNSFIMMNTESGKKERPFLGAGVFNPDMSEQLRMVVEQSRLKTFLSDPSKYFVTNVLEINLNEQSHSRLSEDEKFDLDMLDFGCIVNELMLVPEENVADTLEHKALLGELPYGVFRGRLQRRIEESVAAVKQTLKDCYGIENYSEIREWHCPKQPWSMLLPRSFFSSFKKIDLVQVAAELGAWQQNPRHKPTFLLGLADDEIWQFDLTLQLSCKSQPVLLSVFSTLKSGTTTVTNSADEKMEDICAAAIAKPKHVFAAFLDAFARYCYCGKLEGVDIVDGAGKRFVLSAFTENNLRLVMNMLLLCFLLNQSRPFPGMQSVISDMTFKKGVLTPAKDQFAYDEYSKFLFDSPALMMQHQVLGDEAEQFYEFYFEYIASNFKELKG